MKALSIVLGQAANNVPHQELSPEQSADLSEIIAGCCNIFAELEQQLAAYSALDSARPGFRGHLEKTYRKLTWNERVVGELRARLSNHVILLTCFNNTLLGPKIARLQEFQTDQEHQRILQWLSPINPAAQRSDFMKKYQEGTDQWFLSSPAYQKYLEKPGKILFCPGKPGAGKTILTSLVASELISRFSSQAEVGIADVYLNTENSELQTEEGIIATLLRQLVQSLGRMPRRVGIMYEEHKYHGTCMSLEELWGCLESTISECGRSFILLNAVDECPQTYGLRSRILSRALSLRDTFKTNVFITSCEIPDVTRKFSEKNTVRICAAEADVRHYLRETIQDMPNLSTQRSELIDETINEIAKAVDGM
jgi:Cdc6-like AAA superfamily ATPase